jgi:hypothetical protein
MSERFKVRQKSSNSCQIDGVVFDVASVATKGPPVLDREWDTGRH